MKKINKVIVGISKCLYGESVRYDGTDKHDRQLLQSFGALVDLFPVCPEYDAGLSSPREPMHLEQSNDSVLLVGNDTPREYTPCLISWIQGCLVRIEAAHVSGFILKACSPSCAIGTAQMYTEKGLICGLTSGLFAAALQENFPDMPIADEEELQDGRVREVFLDNVVLYSCRKK